jgi:hypothetical protein
MPKAQSVRVTPFRLSLCCRSDFARFVVDVEIFDSSNGFSSTDRPYLRAR